MQSLRFFIVLAVLAIGVSVANATLVLTIDNYTTTELSFSISGTFPTTTVGAAPGYLAIKNDWSNNTGVTTDFGSGVTIVSDSIDIGGLTTTTDLKFDTTLTYADSIYFRNTPTSTAFAAGTPVSGSVTMNGTFDPSDAATLELVSGYNFSPGANGDWARFEAVAVPEPSAFVFGGLVCSVLGMSYARKRMSSAKQAA